MCLMLRVQIAEYIMWQLRVAYFQKYVNLKGLTTWDKVSARSGFVITQICLPISPFFVLRS